MTEKRYDVASIDHPDGISLIRDIRANNNNILLAGSAISLFPPTSIPTGEKLTRDIANLLAGQFAMPEKTKRISEYIKSTPFEYINDQCPNISVLDRILPSLFFPRDPNPVHESIATLVNSNVFESVITTNYDACLEQLLPDRDPLVQVVLSDDLGRITGESRILFKIHGSAIPAKCKSMVYRLSQEGELQEWKRDLLLSTLQDKTLIVLGYSGKDFELCPEIVESNVKHVVWITIEDPDQISHNADRLLSKVHGTLLIGDLRKVVDELGSPCKADDPQAPASDLCRYLSDHLSETELRLWACSVLSQPGYASYAEHLARILYKKSQPGSIERAFSAFYLGDALFSRGRYSQSATLTSQASEVFLSYDRFDFYVRSEAKGVDSLRCAGRFGIARNRLESAQHNLSARSSQSLEILMAKLDLQEILILREEYARAEAVKSLGIPILEPRMKTIQLKATELLAKVVPIFARTGQWHDLQQCRMWAGRMNIDFEDLYAGRLKPPEDMFGWKHLGHKVPEMMAVRDRLFKEGPVASSKEKLLEFIDEAIDIGCDPEVWKLSLALCKYYEPKYYLTKSIMWLQAFLLCEYTPTMRVYKLMFERYR